MKETHRESGVTGLDLQVVERLCATEELLLSSIKEGKAEMELIKQKMNALYAPKYPTE